MAVKTVAVTTLKLSEGTTVPATTALNGSTDTLSITGGSGGKIVLLIENTTAAEKEIVIKKGESPPALRQGVGDLTIKFLEKTAQLVPIESARFANAEGNVIVSCAASTTGFISAVKMPTGF
jgi:hypothetical protein